MDTPRPLPVPPASLLWRILRGVRVALITLFVCWHLLFLLVRNPLDLWSETITDWLKGFNWWDTTVVEVPWADTPEKDATPAEIETARHYKVKVSADWAFTKINALTTSYGNFFGIDQGWSMFAPPLARSAYFLEVELTFNDASTAMVYSPNEPDVTQRGGLTSGYIRLGGWRQRKLEDYLVDATDEKGSKPVSGKTDQMVYQAYIRWCVRRWRDKNADDPRKVVKVALRYRLIRFPKPGADPTVFEVETGPLATFTPEGKLLKP